MQIIPAIDLIDGKCVRLTQGDYSRKKEYSASPLDVARRYEARGLKRLHLVDLDGAKAKRIVNYKVLEGIASKTDLKIDFGGGLRSDEDLRIAFESGAGQVTGGSIAVKNPWLFREWIERFGAGKIILGADVIGENIAVSGWQEESGLNLFDFVRKYHALGLTDVICTDVAKDGLLQGPSLELYRKFLDAFPKINLIASGGVASVEDLKKLKALQLSGTIVGKAIYENRIGLEELEKINRDAD